MAAVGTLHLAIEVPDSRYRDFRAHRAAPPASRRRFLRLLFSCSALRPSGWRGVDLAAHPVVGHRTAPSSSAAAAPACWAIPASRSPWLANDRAARGDGLKAGQIITTGTCVKPMPIAPGDQVVADFGALGRVRVDFPASRPARSTDQLAVEGVAAGAVLDLDHPQVGIAVDARGRCRRRPRPPAPACRRAPPASPSRPSRSRAWLRDAAAGLDLVELEQDRAAFRLAAPQQYRRRRLDGAAAQMGLHPQLGRQPLFRQGDGSVAAEGAVGGVERVLQQRWSCAAWPPPRPPAASDRSGPAARRARRDSGRPAARRRGRTCGLRHRSGPPRRRRGRWSPRCGRGVRMGHAGPASGDEVESWRSWSRPLRCWRRLGK